MQSIIVSIKHSSNCGFIQLESLVDIHIQWQELALDLYKILYGNECHVLHSSYTCIKLVNLHMKQWDIDDFRMETFNYEIFYNQNNQLLLYSIINKT